jgi:hypothetical protein
MTPARRLEAAHHGGWTCVTMIDDNNSMKGKVSFAGFGEGTFTGKRK